MNMKSRRAFTLLELLVVIAIIAILVSLLLTSLSRSKQKAQGTYCANNLKQMQIAWTLYADDFAQTLVPNVGGAEPDYLPNLSWVAGDANSLPDETNTSLLSGALLGPYAKDVGIYRCPGDPGNPRGTLRARSISMNCYMHGKGSAQDSDFIQNIRTDDIAQPSASYVFLDERFTTINDGYFAVGLTTNFDDIGCGDIPANYHNQCGSFSFADGHAQLKKWQTDYFQESAPEPGMPIPDNLDYEWLMQNTTVPLAGAWPTNP
jgi:prepilin-type N-terminal cleavage/methylation domain-containing protein